jgi:hypothetical protein
MLYRNATPRSVHPFAAPGPRLLERLLDEVSTKHRSGRRRWLYAVAAAVVFAVGGSTVAMVSGHGSTTTAAATTMTATDPQTGVWAQITSEDRVWGSEIDVTVKDKSGPHACHLVAVGKDGSEQTVTSWMDPAEDAEATTMQGGAALQSEQIDHYEVRTKDGQHLVTLKSR